MPKLDLHRFALRPYALAIPDGSYLDLTDPFGILIAITTHGKFIRCGRRAARQRQYQLLRNGAIREITLGNSDAES